MATRCSEIQGARGVLVFPPMDRQIFLDHIRHTRFAPGDKAAAQRDARRIARYLVGQGTVLRAFREQVRAFLSWAVGD